jgi:hypothetical protein
MADIDDDVVCADGTGIAAVHGLDDGEQAANAAHMATFDPPTVLYLLDCLEAAEAGRKAAEEERDDASKCISDLNRDVVRLDDELSALKARMEEMREAAKTVSDWLAQLPILDMEDVVADGGVTAAMVVQQQAIGMMNKLDLTLAQPQEQQDHG